MCNDIEKINEMIILKCKHNKTITYSSGEEFGMCSICEQPVMFISLPQHNNLIAKITALEKTIKNIMEDK